jgi:hypothetical protein
LAALMCLLMLSQIITSRESLATKSTEVRPFHGVSSKMSLQVFQAFEYLFASAERTSVKTGVGVYQLGWVFWRSCIVVGPQWYPRCKSSSG